jgi:predicted nucleotidyltransferase
VPDHAFTRAKIVEALQALGDELKDRGLRGQIFIVGGAAMALAYSTRRITKDIDAVFEPKSAIYDAAVTVAENLDLPEDWLNDAAKGYMPGNDLDPRPIADIRGIEVTTASPRYLLAMKLVAMRFGEDDEDIELLLRECGLDDTEETISLLQQMYPLQDPPAKTRFYLEQLFGSKAPSQSK